MSVVRLLHRAWPPARAWHPARRLFGPDPDRFLRDVRGVMHIGASTGQERRRYARRGLDVLWVEPIPEVFAALAANIAAYPRQRALQALVTDRDDVDCAFHVSSNAGESSSILALKAHRDVWPEVTFVRSMALTSVTLPTLLAREGIDPSAYDALVLDTQGSELLVLRGAAPLLSRLRYIKTEVPDFEAYAGCAQVGDIDAFLRPHGYMELSRHQFASRPGVGQYYDIVYRRDARG